MMREEGEEEGCFYSSSRWYFILRLARINLSVSVAVFVPSSRAVLIALSDVPLSLSLPRARARAP